MKTFLHIWLAPIILGIVSAIGLLSALTGDGFWDVLSWITLGIPVIVGGYYLIKNLQRTGINR
ncbi:MAG: hypothetical protein EOP51_25445 [Sphingobacteriales bacterium]|nr:MAG: hypothetical protein EOP51_25445 [Sphingobacteriales bacterium]